MEEIVKRIENDNINSKENKKEHVQNIRRNVRENKKKEEQGICPKCGGELVERKGKYGVFIGCSNYPKCHFTRKK